MSASGSPGFIFWGVLLTFGLIVAGYVVWMLGVEARERKRVSALKTDSLRDDRPRAASTRPARTPSETEP